MVMEWRASSWRTPRSELLSPSSRFSASSRVSTESEASFQVQKSSMNVWRLARFSFDQVIKPLSSSCP